MIKKTKYKVLFIIYLACLCILALLLCLGIGSIKFSIKQVVKGLFINDDSVERLIIFNTRLPRIIIGGLVGISLSLSGCILQGVMRNNLASPSTIGVTGGASFVGYLTLVIFRKYTHLLPIGAIVGAFVTTMLIYLLSYRKGVSPVRMILAGLAVGALFGAFTDVIRTFWTEKAANASSFLVGGLNGVTWDNLKYILPYSLVGIGITIFLPSRMNILMLGDETAISLGLNTEVFRFFLIAISSLLAGSSVAVAGMISFVGLIVPHISRLLVGSDYKYLFPASIFLGFFLVIVCDTIGRVILPPGEVPVGIILALIGAPFFLMLIRMRKR